MFTQISNGISLCNKTLLVGVITHCRPTLAANVAAAWRSGGGSERLGREANFQNI